MRGETGALGQSLLIPTEEQRCTTEDDDGEDEGSQHGVYLRECVQRLRPLGDCGEHCTNAANVQKFADKGGHSRAMGTGEDQRSWSVHVRTSGSPMHQFW